MCRCFSDKSAGTICTCFATHRSKLSVASTMFGSVVFSGWAFAGWSCFIPPVARLSAWPSLAYARLAVALDRRFARSPPGQNNPSIFFRGLEVNLLKHLILLPSRAGQNAAAVFHHVGMAAEIAGGILRCESPDIGVLADQIVHAAGFAAPRFVLPRTADR